jgi:hypothetical protein
MSEMNGLTFSGCKEFIIHSRGRYSTMDEFIMADCCHLFYPENVFFHEKMGKKLDDVRICIHCHLLYNISIYENEKALDNNDKKILEIYLDKFKKDHTPGRAICKKITERGGKCLLCNNKYDIINMGNIYTKRDNRKLDIIFVEEEKMINYSEIMDNNFTDLCK